MEIPGAGKSPNTTLSFRYNANNEVLEELYNVCGDDPPTPQFDNSPSMRSESASPKRGDKTPSILDKYFKSIRAADKTVPDKVEKQEEKTIEAKSEETKSTQKDVSASPVKDYLNRLGKRGEHSEVKEVGGNETWKLFHDFKFKIAQAVEDIKTRSVEETKEKSIPRDSSISDSEENSAIKDSDQSVGDTDNQVSSLHSSIQNLSEVTQPLITMTTKPMDHELSLPHDKNISDNSDDTQKNFVNSETQDFAKDPANVFEVESGIEALEDSIDAFSNDPHGSDMHHGDSSKIQIPQSQSKPHKLGSTPSNSSLIQEESVVFFTFTLYILTFLVLFNCIVFPETRIWNGFLLGIWAFYIISNAKKWILHNYFGQWEPTKKSFFPSKRVNYTPVAFTIPSVKEHRPLKKFEGWINHYRFPEYDPYEYSVNKTTTAFMKLEGCNLRISYTRKKIAKRAMWDEKIEDVTFYQHRLYNLTGARILILPKGLVKRRQWSKKYPICVILNEHENIQVLEKESAAVEKKLDSLEKKKDEPPYDTDSLDTNTSPEKKKKFVWRRKEKRISETPLPSVDLEPLGKEGLRNRIARKMHRDKKTDNTALAFSEPLETLLEKSSPQELVFHDAETELATKSATSTRDDVDAELDDNEYSRIKDFIESTDFDAGSDGAAEGEWSLHIKRSSDKHSKLFIFARTGRDKHEWYRRLATAIHEASVASNESSVAEDKATSDKETKEDKDAGEMALYKAGERESVSFAKGTKESASMPDTVTVSTPIQMMSAEFENYEKQFWGFLQKIIESRQTGGPCDCKRLPAEVTWLNTLVARMAYDLMRNQQVLERMQTKIQKKLHTIKLPSFMSPLVVTELSLTGACPLVQSVSAPAWDERGVWLDADVAYEGGAYISILTQINLLKLKEKNVTLEDTLMTVGSDMTQDSEFPSVSNFYSEKPQRKQKRAIYDSEAEDSAESSEDEESPPVQPIDSDENILGMADTQTPTDTPSSSSKKKFLRMVDKIATNKYFQQVTDYKYVKRAMEGLSNTDIKLYVEVQALEGRLALNLPPPPHDRVWFGFRTNPNLVLKARPAVGARTLRFAHISNWIEQKLSKEFEKILVLPNMEDITVDVMAPTPIEFE